MWKATRVEESGDHSRRGEEGVSFPSVLSWVSLPSVSEWMKTLWSLMRADPLPSGERGERLPRAGRGRVIERSCAGGGGAAGSVVSAEESRLQLEPTSPTWSWMDLESSLKS